MTNGSIVRGSWSRRFMMAAIIQAVILLLIVSTAIAPYNSYAQDISMHDEDLTLIVNIEASRGHLMQALNNKSIGNDNGAIAHAGHPAAEHLDKIAPIIEKRNPELINELRDKLTRLPSKVPAISYEELRAEIDAIDALFENASNLISDENKGSVQFWFEVMKMLLEHTEEEYEEGVEEEGTVSNIIEYEDAQAFIVRAEHVFTTKVKDSISSDTSVVIERFFNDVKMAMDEKRSADRIKELVDGIMPVIPEFPINLMLILVGVVALTIMIGRVLMPIKATVYNGYSNR
ncbi:MULTISPECIES: hypothetical protein [Candidatus Nitrosocaldus]|jgi:hypothetical protein|uniref:Uncharacterized protein n=1 Tax=Candidatus Nitrosocaldus cavascurensis TaxID=2058097 RepID=A0A2K5ASN8_9ARCH|nr:MULTISPECIES: hypothetical protein [Candidatus Nitrosocaldus]SPC34651.1 protein of unknown function [Candidatus Nitrosocaldus cavascurensis]